MKPFTPEQLRIMRNKGVRRRRIPATVNPAPRFTDEALTGWGEIIGFAVVSLLATIGIAAMSAVLWLILTVVALPADLGPPAPWMPNPTTTPGAIDDSINVKTLCEPHHSTKAVRPDVDYTNKLKAEQLLGSDDYSDKNHRDYEEDHLVPLEIGGHPSDPRNLWPQYWNGRCGAHVKDRLENELHDLVCAGKIGLAEARGEIASDWVRSYNLHVGPLSCP